MSITTDNRSPTEEKFETGEAFKALATYTVQVCKNEKNFPKRDRWLLTQEIVKAAVKAYGHVIEANAIEVKTVKDYELRRQHQIKAKNKLKKMNAYVEVAHMALQLDPAKIDTWEGYYDKCKKLLSNWRDSDRRRYKKILDEFNREQNEAKLKEQVALIQQLEKYGIAGNG